MMKLRILIKCDKQIQKKFDYEDTHQKKTIPFSKSNFFSINIIFAASTF